MRFITEFELQGGDLAYDGFKEHITERHKTFRTVEIGEMIAESFGWQNPVLGNPLRHRLEIEAFPMEKWVYFRNNLIANLPMYDDRSAKAILNLLKELESYGKPAGEAKETKS